MKLFSIVRRPLGKRTAIIAGLAIVGAIAFGTMPAVAACEDATALVSVSSTFATGPGHCSGEVVLHMQNNASSRVSCVTAFEKTSGTWEGGMNAIPAGQARGGEGSGLWTCDGTGRYKYYCAVQPHSADDWSCKYPKIDR